MNAEQIAARLSPAQKRAVLWCNGDGTPKVHLKGPETSFYCLWKVILGDPRKQVAQIYSLAEHGKSTTEKRGLWPASTWKLTPFGLEVRAILEKQP
jgi:hypothetical protein